MDDGVVVAGNVRKDAFKEEDTSFSVKDGGIIVILLDKTDGVFHTSPN